MGLLTAQASGLIPPTTASGVSPWAFVVALAIAAGCVLGKKVIDIAIPTVGVGGAGDDSVKGQGGAVDDSVKSAAWDLIKKSIVVILIACSLGYIGYLKYQLYREGKKIELLVEEEMPENAKYKVEVKKNKVIIRDKSGKKVEIDKPRGKDLEAIIDEDGNIVYNKFNAWMPYFTAIPHFSVIATPKQIDPAISVQVVRSEAAKVGINVDVGLEHLGGSITRDILDNSNLGLFYGFDHDGKGVAGLKFGIYF